MNDLKIMEIQMTSLELAEVTGKEHRNILRDVRNEAEALGEEGQLIFEQSSYFNEQNKEQPCYKFGREGAMQLALKYDALTRRRVIIKLDELEKASRPTGSNLLALAVLEAQKMLTEKDAVIEQQQARIEMDKPKVVFADAVSVSKTSILVGDLAKILKQNGIDTGAVRFFAWLRANGYLIKRQGTDYNMPTQTSMNLGLFEIKETTIAHSDGHTTIIKTPKVTGKGQVYFVNKLKED